ncbi:MAG TPA: farnesyl diphosphate synthase [Acidobacteriota bacterium]|nr:farnesyl diphosphate synthase [Acidobacteriota bacterium]
MSSSPSTEQGGRQSPSADFPAYMKAQAEIIDRRLDEFLPPPEQPPAVIHEAMRYAMFAGGKRLRPVLAVTVAEALQGPMHQVLPLACGLEMIHCFSLIHDDLPAMDDDDFRRGKPTLHRCYDEAVAILAGDALLNLALQVVSETPCQDARQVRRVLEVLGRLCRATGSVGGMIAGQVEDMSSQGQEFDADRLHLIHSAKTGALITAAVECSALLCGASQEDLRRLGAYGRHIGLAFQVVDDILDVEGSRQQLGKSAGKDQAAAKATFPSLYGVEESRRMAEELVEKAVAEVSFLGDRARMLCELARFISVRRF